MKTKMLCVVTVLVGLVLWLASRGGDPSPRFVDDGVEARPPLRVAGDEEVAPFSADGAGQSIHVPNRAADEEDVSLFADGGAGERNAVPNDGGDDAEPGFVTIAGERYTVERDGVVRRLVHASTGAVYAEGEWRGGLREGLHRSWYPNGNLISETNWIAGNRQGAARYYGESGVLTRSGSYVNGYMSGEWSSWYENGQLASRGRYECDERQQSKVGPWVSYDPEGNPDPHRSGYYVDGKKAHD